MKVRIATYKRAATDTEGEEVVAKDPDGTVAVVPWDYALGTFENHLRPIKKLYPSAEVVNTHSTTRGYWLTVEV